VTVFNKAYAGAYDALYGEKDYGNECDMIEALLAEFGAARPAHRLLDLGCGTGGHAIPLARRGYSVTGVDRSCDMLAHARAKAAAASVEATTRFQEGDLRHFRLDEEPFDAAIMMFAVLGYQTSDSDVKAALVRARAHLLTGAAFIFDAWYGPGVLADRPGPRERLADTPDGRIRRHTTAALDETKHLCTVRFDLERWRGAALAESVEEHHVMRYFFPEEIGTFAALAGFRLATLRCFPDWRKSVDDGAWTAVGVLCAI
jgi:SAM-dependent methyltransferase